MTEISTPGGLAVAFFLAIAFIIYLLWFHDPRH